MKFFQKKFVILLGIFSLILAGCATDPTHIPDRYSSTDNSQKGQIVGSLGYLKKSTLLSIDLLIRRKGDKEGILIRFGNDNTFFPADFSNGDQKAKIFQASVPEGEYEIYDVGFSVGHGSLGVDTHNSKQQFSIPITVEKGKITYIGQFLCETIYRNGFFGLDVPSGGIYHVSDQGERDIAFAKSKNPGLAKYDVLQMVISPKSHNLPYFSD
jgi:hypothetical protein